MSIRQTLATIVILATSSIVLAQTTETKPPDGDSSGTHSSQSPTIPPLPLNRGRKEATTGLDPEILTDTMDVDFGPYVKTVLHTIEQNWIIGLPLSAFPPVLKQGKDSIDFTILKNGQISGMVWHRGSGSIELDRAAWGSITGPNPLPPLPREFPGPDLGLRLNFYLNMTIDEIRDNSGGANQPSQGSSQPSERSNQPSLGPSQPLNLCHFDSTEISISPCVDVRVPAGSTRQFAASGKDITDASVTWSISGPGCSKSACGTISAAGLYTAPVRIPNPPRVIVKATLRTDMSISSKSEVTLVWANPSD